MPNVVVIAKDDRLRRQLEGFLGELDVANLRFATFASEREFAGLYLRDKSVHHEASDSGGGTELKLFSEIHLLIAALDTLEGKPGPWIDNVRTHLKQFHHLPTDGEMRMMLLKFEEDGQHKLEFLHPALDDLVYLPLDRLVVLQKLQIFLSLPRRPSPSYLFNQEVAQEIEISKITKLDRFSDVGLAIRNPLPLKKGLPGHFYVNLPGEKNRLELYGKVMRSEPHPDFPGQYLVYFSYFALSRVSLTQIRRVLSKSPQYRSLISDDRARVAYQPDNLFQEDEDRHHFGTLVIDSDDLNGRSLAEILKKDMDRLNVASESSYQAFLHRYLEIGGSRDNTPPRGTAPEDFYANPITLTVSARDLKCLSVDPGPVHDSTFLGYSALTLFSTPERWLALMQDHESKLILEEAVYLVAGGRVLEKLMTMVDLNSVRRAVNLRIYRGTAEGTVFVELSPATMQDVLNKADDLNRSREIESLIVDTNFLPADPAAWIDGLRLRATQIGLVSAPEKLKFWLISDSEQFNHFTLNNPDVLGLYVRPVDTRQLLFSMSENLPNKNTLYQFENVGWAEPALTLHVAKETVLEALSEYGATLKSKQKLMPGTIIYLRKSIYENAPNGCLAARVYACIEHPLEKELYQIFTTYFGINDAFLRFARTWIRENYANSKSQ